MLVSLLLLLFILISLLLVINNIYTDSKKKCIDKLIYGSVYRDKKHEFLHHEYKYINYDINFLTELCPLPPKNTSEHTYRELLFLEKKMKNINSEKIDIFKKLDNHATINFTSYLDKNNLKIDWNEFDELLKEIELITYRLKYIYNRPRAYQLGTYFDIPINSQYANSGNTPAYPSGHAMIGHMCYLYLSKLYPNHKQKLYKLAKEVENSRVNVGVHYVSDGNASEIFVNNLFPYLENKLYLNNLNSTPDNIIF